MTKFKLKMTKLTCFLFFMKDYFNRDKKDELIIINNKQFFKLAQMSKTVLDVLIKTKGDTGTK